MTLNKASGTTFENMKSEGETYKFISNDMPEEHIQIGFFARLRGVFLSGTYGLVLSLCSFFANSLFAGEYHRLFAIAFLVITVFIILYILAYQSKQHSQIGSFARIRSIVATAVLGAFLSLYIYFANTFIKEEFRLLLFIVLLVITVVTIACQLLYRGNQIKNKRDRELNEYYFYILHHLEVIQSEGDDNVLKGSNYLQPVCNQIATFFESLARPEIELAKKNPKISCCVRILDKYEIKDENNQEVTYCNYETYGRSHNMRFDRSENTQPWTQDHSLVQSFFLTDQAYRVLHIPDISKNQKDSDEALYPKRRSQDTDIASVMIVRINNSRTDETQGIPLGFLSIHSNRKNTFGKRFFRKNLDMEYTNALLAIAKAIQLGLPFLSDKVFPVEQEAVNEKSTPLCSSAKPRKCRRNQSCDNHRIRRQRRLTGSNNHPPRNSSRAQSQQCKPKLRKSSSNSRFEKT